MVICWLFNGSIKMVPYHEPGEKYGHYFLKILDEQSNRLLALADRKIQQFKGLCTNNINQCAGEAFPITNQDLQGFWDIVMLQVDQVDKIFEDINTLRQNNWIEDTTKKVEVKRRFNKTTQNSMKAEDE
ncbi:hypothetical protein HUJ04_004821 [Dendroctonus ponderosae]|nr:hypothetical protein HUJ04_004821 [Dendroctonus ponderosae]